MFRLSRLFSLLLLAFMALPVAAKAAPEHTLSLNLPIPPIHTRWAEPLQAWVNEVEKRSDGRLAIEPYFAEALSLRSEAFDSVKSGIADLTECAYEANTGQFPFHEGIASIPSPGSCLANPMPIIEEMYARFPQVKEELKGVKFLFGHVSPNLTIGTKSKEIKTLDDLKGLKINSNSAMISERLKLLGVSVVSMPMSDVYTALEQGVIDGTTLNYELLVSRRFGDQIKYMCQLSVQNTLFYMVMNEDVFKGLPPDLQKVIDEVSGEFAAKAFADYWATTEAKAIETWKNTMGAKGVTILSDADYAKAKELMQPPVDAWFKALESKGLPGKDMEKVYYEMEAKVGQPWKDEPLHKLMSK